MAAWGGLFYESLQRQSYKMLLLERLLMHSDNIRCLLMQIWAAVPADLVISMSIKQNRVK